jgi:L-asparaginase II
VDESEGQRVVTLLAEVTRGGAVESIHHGTVVVVDVAGRTVASAGDPETFAYFRSSAKPFQAVPVVESGAADRFGLTPAELALCCASHSAEAMHQDQVLELLAKLGLDDSALQCGIPLPTDEHETAAILSGAKARSPLQCDCSGKHSGMLATCLQLGYPIESSLEPDHPLQRAIRAIVAEVCRVPSGSLRLATDGCSVPTFGTSVRAMAQAFATLAAPGDAPSEAGRDHAVALDRLRSAMTAHPENVGGSHGRFDTDLMRISRGALVAKGGAEGLMCVGVPAHGVGVAVRIADGSFRAHGVVVLRVLEALALVDPATLAALQANEETRILNHNERHVGDIRAAFTLARD